MPTDSPPDQIDREVVKRTHFGGFDEDDESEDDEVCHGPCYDHYYSTNP